MASIVPFNRLTRASSVSPRVSGKSERSASHGRASGAKRRMVYPDDNPSPAKKKRDSPDEEENSPMKVKAKSFYGRGRATYLNPLQRKKLKDWGKSSEESGENEAPPEEPKMPALKKSPAASLKKSKKKEAKKTPKKPLSSKTTCYKKKNPLQELSPTSYFSPSKNKIKTETRIYSPSRKDQKFFKSRRKTDSGKKAAAVVQKRRGLKLTYQPRGISSKSKEEPEKPAFLRNNQFVPPNLSKAKTTQPQTSKPRSPRKPVVHSLPDEDDCPAARTRSSPVKSGRTRASPVKAARTRSSPVKTPSLKVVREVISSSKNPNSPDLFSPSDWDFGDDDDDGPEAEAETPIVSRPLEQDDSPSSSTTSKSVNCSSTEQRNLDSSSACDDSVRFVTEPSDLSSRCTSPGSVDGEGVDPSVEIPEVKPKFYGIFNSKTSRAVSESSSATSSPIDSRRRGRGTRSASRLKSLVGKDGKEQMTLDFGQTLKGAVVCESCGMTYNHGEPSDEAMHTKFHNKVFTVLKFSGWKKETVLQEMADGSRIIVVMPDEKIAMRKVLAVKKIVDEDLGFVVEANAIGVNSKTFMFISEEKQIVGFCVAEKISQAYRVLPGSEKTDSGDDKTPLKPWCCSMTPQKVRCGVNRIWVMRTERRKNIASKLIDCVRANFLLGFPLRKLDLAFTDPTPDGRAFAAKYSGTASFLVYKH